MPRKCPDCRLPLNAVTMKGVVVDTCGRCAGIFFDEGEINQLRLDGNDALSALDEAIQPSEDHVVDFQHQYEAQRGCPKCGAHMEKVRYLYSSPIILDSCPICSGVWVENGELNNMREVLEQDATGASGKTEVMVTVAQMRVSSEAEVARVKRLERAMRILNRRTY